MYLIDSDRSKGDSYFSNINITAAKTVVLAVFQITGLYLLF